MLLIFAKIIYKGAFAVITYKKISMTFFFLAAIVLMLSACGPALPGSNSPGSNLTPLQVLQKSADAMKQVKSSHIELKSTTSTQAVGTTTATPGTGSTAATPPTSSTPTQNVPGTTAPGSTNVNTTITGSGDQANTDQSQFNVTINSAVQPIKLAEVMKGDSVYIQNPQGKWYVISKSQLGNNIPNPMSGMTFDQNSLLAALQDAQIVDHHDETLNGMNNVRHITATLDKTAFKQLLSANPQLASQMGQQNVNTFLDNAQKLVAVVDVWIDETAFHVQRTQLKLDIAENTKSMSPQAPAAVNLTMNTTVDLSKFNQPVKITVPANATPTSDPSVIFNMNGQTLNQ